MKNNNNSKSIRIALTSNAIFSGLCGIDLLVFNRFFSNLMGVSEPFVLTIIGIGLLIFSATLFLTAFAKEIKPKAVKIITAQDWAWVIGSIVILTGGFFDLTVIGNVLIAAVALVVASFALLQRHYMK